MGNDTGNARLFFALWPHAEVRAALAAWVHSHAPALPGVWVDPENLHITLVYLGSVSAETRHCVTMAATKLPFEPHRLRLDHIDYFVKPQVLYAGASVVPVPLMELVQRLRAVALSCGVQIEDRPFVPHTTLLRKVRTRPHDAMAFPALNWPVEGFALVESQSLPTGVRYRVRERWGTSR
ncbi:MAG: RNA 2',3'-cyclic phosphodiesterase [Gammaproteobacteria bacterium]|nr:RNA 2',3'-cyclic phosphodiesterase [Gammaproteobacteria bacterium]